MQAKEEVEVEEEEEGVEMAGCGDTRPYFRQQQHAGRGYMHRQNQKDITYCGTDRGQECGKGNRGFVDLSRPGGAADLQDVGESPGVRGVFPISDHRSRGARGYSAVMILCRSWPDQHDEQHVSWG